MKQESNPRIKAHAKDFALLFSVPLGAIALILAFLYIPRFFAHPTYDFVYCLGYYCDKNYTVDPSGKIHMSTDDGIPRYSIENSSLRYYDTVRDTTRPLSVDEAMRYQLDPTSKSPDGYTVSHNSNNGGFLFWGSNYGDDWSLRNGMLTKPVTLDNGGDSVKFIGWVVHNER